jgi:hypothetical protein
MKKFWNDDNRLGRELRASKPSPSYELESTIEQQVEDSRRAPRGLPGLRLGLAATVTALLVGSFAVAGGMAAASSSVRSAFSDVAQVVHISTPSHQSAPSATPASDQYGRKVSCVNTAANRRTASIRAANAKLKARLAAATKTYKAAVARAKGRYAQSTGSAKQLQKALAAAWGKYLKARHAAFKAHAQAVARANARYKADVKKCPAV